ncbi:PLDc N-terminal domain-containing protein [Cellulomonas soli]|uniref:Cardiolipin synthase N-terminal domain-containing protein n=1 Tax=Cellulomonas soli TaxID=931535 RepID=A0A512PG58_9CELL|nr:PLDc N-terminal domain-containing protein [Cellulomonas soli]NYI58053.1 hypothetical protein [Cellulomonas soli]GEP70188.1 hypothetical protein CSO01_29030 [Cellulomonas soli]
MRYLPLLLAIGLAVYCALDVARSTEEERLGLPRVVWTVLVVVAPFVGGIVWLVVSRSRRAAVATGTTGSPGPSVAPGRRRPGPVAPDDDPDFLRGLDDERRRREQGTAEGGAGESGQRPE